MKIAIVSPVMVPVPPPKYGGIQLIVAEIAEGLAKRGHQVTVFCSGESTIGGKNITRVASSTHSTKNFLKNSRENRLWEELQMEEIVRRQKEFDVVHMHYEPAVCKFKNDDKETDFSRLLKVPTVFTFHNSTSVPQMLEYYRGNVPPKNHNFVFISKNQQKPLRFLPNSQVIYNGIPIGLFPMEKNKEDFLLFLGRITPDKGILEAIEVAQKTKKPLTIAASISDKDRKFYKKEIFPKIDGKLIRYVGEADFTGKIEYLKKASCLLFPILWEEPFGLVMIEALACGTPVIAFRRGSVPEIIRDGENGFIVENVGQMAEAVTKTGKISADKCRKSVEKRFSVERMVDEYENVFKRIMKKRK